MLYNYQQALKETKSIPFRNSVEPEWSDEIGKYLVTNPYELEYLRVGKYSPYQLQNDIYLSEDAWKRYGNGRYGDDEEYPAGSGFQGKKKDHCMFCQNGTVVRDDFYGRGECNNEDCKKINWVEWGYWSAIGKELDNYFASEFDGNGHVIYGLKVKTTRDGGFWPPEYTIRQKWNVALFLPAQEAEQSEEPPTWEASSALWERMCWSRTATQR